MYSNFNQITAIALHKVGNKLNEEPFLKSKSLLNLSVDVQEILVHYFTSHFKSEEYYHFHHDINLVMNEVYACISAIFDDSFTLLEQSVNIASLLYERSNHPKIKGGEFYIVYFSDCMLDGKLVDAIGLFKSENRDIFLKIFPQDDSFNIESEKGININKLDKGCLIFNTDRESGYRIIVVDNTNRGVEAQYWIDDFLGVVQRKDDYYKTQNVMTMCKNFVQNELPQHFEVSKADQIDLLNRSVQFFKENEEFEMDTFTKEVIVQPEVIASFDQFKKDFQEEQEVDSFDNFSISNHAVKKQSRVFKSVIKLDKNFHIYVHGNRELIEQGTDEIGRKFYKIYYKEEI
jgi:hypothetical protein